MENVTAEMLRGYHAHPQMGSESIVFTVVELQEKQFQTSLQQFCVLL